MHTCAQIYPILRTNIKRWLLLMKKTHQARQAVFQRFKEHESARSDSGGARYADTAEGQTFC
jgi:hypothetical protein